MLMERPGDPITDNRRRDLNTASAEPHQGATGFYVCPACGQRVDETKLGDVMWHEQAEHGAID